MGVCNIFGCAYDFVVSHFRIFLWIVLFSDLFLLLFFLFFQFSCFHLIQNQLIWNVLMYRLNRFLNIIKVYKYSAKSINFIMCLICMLNSFSQPFSLLLFEHFNFFLLRKNLIEFRRFSKSILLCIYIFKSMLNFISD